MAIYDTICIGTAVCLAKTVYQETCSKSNVKWNELFYIWLKLILQGAEKHQVQTSRGDREAAHNKDLLSRNYMYEIGPCSATDGQIGSE